MTAKIDSFVKKIATTHTKGSLFNPYNQFSKEFDDREAPGIRQQNLRLYLNSHVKTKTKNMWVYLAPTFQEARKSGVPLVNSSVYSKVEGVLNTKRGFEKATKKNRVPNSTPLSSSLWSAAYELEVNPIIWPVIPFYAHKKDDIKTKRIPTKDEVINYRWFIDKIIEIYNPKNIIAVGKETKKALDYLDIKSKLVNNPRIGKEKFKKSISRYK